MPSTDVGGFLTWTRTFFKYHQVAAGGDFRLIDGQSQDSFYNFTGTVIADRRVSSGRQNFFGAYIEDVFQPTDYFQVDASVRGDFFDSYRRRDPGYPCRWCAFDRDVSGPHAHRHQPQAGNPL